MKDLGRALSTYEVVLDRAPRHEAAARAIVRIHETEGRWERVIDAERRLLDLATRPEDVVDGLVRIARIFEEHLGRVEDSISAYLEALHRAPAYVPVVAALERLLRATGDYRRLAQVLQRYADATSNPIVKVRTRVRAATVLELCLDDTDTATAAYMRALVDAGPCGGPYEAERHAALWGLFRLQETRGEWENVEATLASILEATSEPSARRRILVRLARNAELRLEDLPRATQYYDEALATGAKPAAMATDSSAPCTGSREHPTPSRTASWRRQRTRPIPAYKTDSCACLRCRPNTAAAWPATRSTRRCVLWTTGGAGYDQTRKHSMVSGAASPGSRRRRLAPYGRAYLAPFMARASTTHDAAVRALMSYSAGVIDETAVRTNAAETAYAFALKADPELV